MTNPEDRSARVNPTCLNQSLSTMLTNLHHTPPVNAAAKQPNGSRVGRHAVNRIVAY